MTRRLALLAALLLTTILAAACGGGRSGDNAARDDAAGSVASGVRTIVVQRASFARSIPALGIVAPRPGGVASLGAPGPTRVARLFVAAGDSVARGDPLLEFERAPFDAEAESRDAGVRAAEKTLERAKRLTQAGVAPTKELDQAEADLAAARAAAAPADRSRELAMLRAPLSGVVTKMSAVLGAAVDMGTELAQIVDTSALDLVLNLSPVDAANVHSGQDVAFAAPGAEAVGSNPSPLGEARVTTVSAVVDSATRGVEVRARIERAGRALRIGESLGARIVTARVPDAIVIPETALLPDGDQYKVFVVDAAGLALARTVQPGSRAAGFVEILSGLSDGERVVVEGGYGLEDSTRVSAARP